MIDLELFIAFEFATVLILLQAALRRSYWPVGYEVDPRPEDRLSLYQAMQLFLQVLKLVLDLLTR